LMRVAWENLRGRGSVSREQRVLGLSMMLAGVLQALGGLFVLLFA
jgi:predicted phage tail protein